MNPFEQIRMWLNDAGLGWGDATQLAALITIMGSVMGLGAIAALFTDEGRARWGEAAGITLLIALGIGGLFLVMKILKFMWNAA